MGRRHIGKPGFADRISNLPDCIVDHILTLLPIRDAVRTSTLARNWRYKWTTIPHLVFDEKFEQSFFHLKWNPETVVYQLLLHHKGPIVKFSMKVLTIKCHDAIDCWLHFLLTHRIENLSLRLPNPVTHNSHLLSSHLFSYDHLTHLHLQNVKIKLPASFKGFDKLVTLELHSFVIDFEELKAFISKCPMLEFLDISTIEHCFLVIDAPNLKRFHFSGFFVSISFGNASLEEISIHYPHNIVLAKYMYSHRNGETSDVRGGHEANFIKIFRQLPSIKSVHLDGHFLEFLALGGALPQTLPVNLNHLTTLYLEIILSKMRLINCTLCLIGSSPNLQNLTLSFDGAYGPYYIPDDYLNKYIKEQQMCNVSLSSLKILKIIGMSGSNAEVEFIKVLLKGSTALEKLEVKPFLYRETDHKQGKHGLLKKLGNLLQPLSSTVLVFI